MDTQSLQYVEIVNRLKRATQDGKLLWERTGSYGQQFRVRLDNGHYAHVAATPNGATVHLTMTSPQHVQTLHLDTTHIADDLLRLALLQLFVSVRDSFTHLVTNEALNAVKDL